MKTVIDKMVHSWEWRDNFLPDCDLSKEEACFYRAAKQDPVCYLPDCKYAGTNGCRVRGLGVTGINTCVKYYPKNDQGEQK